MCGSGENMGGAMAETFFCFFGFQACGDRCLGLETLISSNQRA